jgi:hypothetical protein
MKKYNTENALGSVFFYEMAQLKLQFNKLSHEGFVDFAKACILQGLMEDDEIIAEACAIGGDHNGARFENLLMEGENIHWRRSRSGQLTLLSN